MALQRTLQRAWMSRCAGFHARSTPNRTITTTGAIVGAYLASLAGSHAPATIRRRLSALDKMHRFNAMVPYPGDSPAPAKKTTAKTALHGLIRGGSAGIVSILVFYQEEQLWKPLLDWTCLSRTQVSVC